VCDADLTLVKCCPRQPLFAEPSFAGARAHMAESDATSVSEQTERFAAASSRWKTAGRRNSESVGGPSAAAAAAGGATRQARHSVHVAGGGSTLDTGRVRRSSMFDVALQAQQRRASLAAECTTGPPSSLLARRKATGAIPASRVAHQPCAGGVGLNGGRDAQLLGRLGCGGAPVQALRCQQRRTGAQHPSRRDEPSARPAPPPRWRG
jgi:hypothetical protein